MSIKEAILAQEKLQELRRWEENFKKVDWSGQKYCLSSQVKLERLCFCGQQYQGAKNYHEAPPWFLQDVQHEISISLVKDAVEKASKKVKDELTLKIENCLDELNNLLFPSNPNE